MPSGERTGDEGPPSFADASSPTYSSALPRDLDDFLRTQRLACLTHPTDRGTALVIKAPSADIHSAEGSVPISFVHELYEHTTAPVIRMLTTIYDQPERPLRLETFINVEDPQQRADYEALSRQDELFLLFYDEEHQHRLTKQVGGVDREQVTAILTRAVEYYELLPENQYSFEIAKAWVMARTDL